MCTALQKISGFIFDKISKYCKNLRKVCRVVALIDALLGLIILVILLIRRIRSVTEYTESTVNNLLFLGLQAFEIAFAIVLYEGVRKEIICMVKLWFCYCLTRFVVLTATVYPTLVSSPKAKVPLLMYGCETTFTLFHIVQCICLLVLRHQSKSTTEENSIGGVENIDSGYPGETAFVPQPQF